MTTRARRTTVRSDRRRRRSCSPARRAARRRGAARRPHRRRPRRAGPWRSPPTRQGRCRGQRRWRWPGCGAASHDPWRTHGGTRIAAFEPPMVMARAMGRRFPSNALPWRRGSLRAHCALRRHRGRPRLVGVHPHLVAHRVEPRGRERLLPRGRAAAGRRHPLPGDEPRGARGLPLCAVVRGRLAAAHLPADGPRRPRLVAAHARLLVPRGLADRAARRPSGVHPRRAPAGAAGRDRDVRQRPSSRRRRAGVDDHAPLRARSGSASRPRSSSSRSSSSPAGWGWDGGATPSWRPRYRSSCSRRCCSST